MNPTVNYHSILEAAHTKYMEETTKVFYWVMEELQMEELQMKERKNTPAVDKREDIRIERMKECRKRIRQLRKRGFSHRCGHNIEMGIAIKSRHPTLV